MELKKNKIVFFSVRWLKHFGFNLSSYCEHCIEHFYKNTKKKSFYSCLNPRLRYQFNLWMLSRGLRGTVVPLPFPDDNCLKHCQRIISNHQQSGVSLPGREGRVDWCEELWGSETGAVERTVPRAGGENRLARPSEGPHVVGRSVG